MSVVQSQSRCLLGSLPSVTEYTLFSTLRQAKTGIMVGLSTGMKMKLMKLMTIQLQNI